jgi:hypothetical protein
MLCPVIWCSDNAAVLVARRADHLTQVQFDELFENDRFPDWDYLPSDRTETPFELKPIDWGWLDGRLVALDYSLPAAAPREEIEELIRNRREVSGRD